MFQIIRNCFSSKNQAPSDSTSSVHGCHTAHAIPQCSLFSLYKLHLNILFLFFFRNASYFEEVSVYDIKFALCVFKTLKAKCSEAKTLKVIASLEFRFVFYSLFCSKMIFLMLLLFEILLEIR